MAKASPINSTLLYRRCKVDNVLLNETSEHIIYIRDRSLNMGGGGPEDFQGWPPIFSQASKGGPLSFSRGQ